MNYMKATKKNEETVNNIIELLEAKNYTVEEAQAILDYVKNRITYTSNVRYEKLVISG